ncbi:CD3324 family protein [Clostridium sp. KNHs214]|uniref:CD3324 family protein n=1 Tax=Clostridium sp. KNHs214 TaxID=1540257 RepID=UPI002570AE5F|nr:CD3324 family protein [Clostridium sp. KNHs214]
MSILCFNTMIKKQRSKEMKYAKAQDVLPEEIVKIIQEYVDGKYLYVPRKNENHKAWGEKSGIKNSLKARNSEIYKKYINGATINALTKEYYLSEKSIRRIIAQGKDLYS